MPPPRALVAWGSSKDSAWVLEFAIPSNPASPVLCSREVQRAGEVEA